MNDNAEVSYELFLVVNLLFVFFVFTAMGTKTVRDALKAKRALQQTRSMQDDGILQSIGIDTAVVGDSLSVADQSSGQVMPPAPPGTVVTVVNPNNGRQAYILRGSVMTPLNIAQGNAGACIVNTSMPAAAPGRNNPFKGSNMFAPSKS